MYVCMFILIYMYACICSVYIYIYIYIYVCLVCFLLGEGLGGYSRTQDPNQTDKVVKGHKTRYMYM